MLYFELGLIEFFHSKHILPGFGVGERFELCPTSSTTPCDLCQAMQDTSHHKYTSDCARVFI